ncbi:MAG: SagB/ThcOx family dehydrogenase [bacterium]
MNYFLSFLKKKSVFISILSFLIFLLLFFLSQNFSLKSKPAEKERIISLPEIGTEKQIEELIYNRSSQRSFSDENISLDIISQLLWSACGITVDGISGPTRAVSSAGATNPLEIYFSAHNIKNLEDGIYKYDPEEHILKQKNSQNKSDELFKAALNQNPVKDSAGVIIISALYERTTKKYGERGKKYVHMEAGSASQNINLTAKNYNLGTVVIGAFDNSEIKRLINIKEEPLLLIPVGKKKL